MKVPLLVAITVMLSGCGNPGDISDAEYAKYKELAAPKILYACHLNFKDISPKKLATCEQEYKADPKRHLECVNKVVDTAERVKRFGYAAGIGFAVTYNSLLADAKAECSGELKVLKSKS